MNKLNRILLILLALQIVVFTAGGLLRSHQKPIIQKKLLPNLDAKEITEIKITDDNKKVVELEKRVGDWVLANSGDYPVKKDKIDELLSKLPGLTAGAPVVTKASMHYALEVDKKKFQRKLEIKRKDKPAISFFLGTSPGIKKVHFRFAGEDAVYAAGDLSTWDIGTSASNWVDTDYFKVDKDKVVALTLQNDQGEIKLSRSDDGKLTLSDLSAKEKVNQSDIDSLLSSASSISFDEPVGKKLNASYELDKPKAVLTLVTETKEEPKEKKPSKGSPDHKAEGASVEGDKLAKKAAAEAQKSLEAKGSPQETHVIRQSYVLRIGAEKNDGYFAKSDKSEFVVRLPSWSAKTLLEKKRADLLQKDEKEKKNHLGAAGSRTPHDKIDG